MQWERKIVGISVKLASIRSGIGEKMEARYLFKAKRVDNGEWVKGALFDGESHCIIGQEIKFSPYIEHECKIVGYEVDRNTICQSTGLRDKNGKGILSYISEIPTAFNTDFLIDRLTEESDASCENFDKYAEEHAICKNENTFSDGLIRAVEIIRECESDGNG